MLDAFIIQRIRREREKAQRDNSRVPLHIEAPTPPPPPKPDEVRRDDEPDNGVAIVDYRL